MKEEMQILRLVAIAAMMLLAATAVRAAAWTSLLANTNPASLYVGPLVYNQTLYGPYGATDPVQPSFWEVSQWLNPVPFMGGATKVVPPNPECSAGGLTGVWSIANPGLRLCSSTAAASSALWPKGATVTQLAQDGRRLQCGNEFDMFLSPIDAAYGRFPQNVQLQFLADVEALQLNVSLQLIAASTKQRCGTPQTCGISGQVDYAYLTVGVPLSNPFTDQTIFFQVMLFDTRWSFCADINPCVAGEPSWYFTALPQLGVNYNLAHFAGQRCLKGTGDATRVALGADLLQALRDSVSYGSAHFGSDGNLSHWRVGSLYIGSGMQGSADITTNVGAISFEALVTNRS